MNTATVQLTIPGTREEVERQAARALHALARTGAAGELHRRD